MVATVSAVGITSLVDWIEIGCLNGIHMLVISRFPAQLHQGRIGDDFIDIQVDTGSGTSLYAGTMKCSK